MTGCTPCQMLPSTVTPDELFAHSRGDTRYLANRVFIFFHPWPVCSNGECSNVRYFLCEHALAKIILRERLLVRAL